MAADTRYKLLEFSHLPHIFPAASETQDGMMSAADKTKLDGLSPSGGGAVPYPTPADFPPAGLNTGAFVIDSSTGALYCSFSNAWCIVAILTPP